MYLSPISLCLWDQMEFIISLAVAFVFSCSLAHGSAYSLNETPKHFSGSWQGIFTYSRTNPATHGQGLPGIFCSFCLLLWLLIYPQGAVVFWHAQLCCFCGCLSPLQPGLGASSLPRLGAVCICESRGKLHSSLHIKLGT